MTERSSPSVRMLRVADPAPLAAVPGVEGAEALERDLAAVLPEQEGTSGATKVSLGRPPGDPLRDAFDVAGRLACEVRRARDEGHLVIVVAGACLTALGSCSGLRSEARSVIWLDAHGDFNTPETTRTGLLDGMALAALTGRCWAGLAGQVPNFRPVPESSVTLIGARDLDDEESQLLTESGIRRWRDVTPRDAREIGASVNGAELYVHLDLDVLDSSVGRANRLASPGGLSSDTLEALFRSLGRQARVGVVALTAYDPNQDEGGGAAAAAVQAVGALVESFGEVHPRRHR